MELEEEVEHERGEVLELLESSLSVAKNFDGLHVAKSLDATKSLDCGSRA